MSQDEILAMINNLAIMEQAAELDGPTWFSEGYHVYDCERQLAALTVTAAQAKYLSALRNAYYDLERYVLALRT